MGGERDKRLMLSIRRKSSSDNHQAGSEPINFSRAHQLLKSHEAKRPRAPTAPTCALPHPHSHPPRRARRQCDDTARESKWDCALPPSPRHALPEKDAPFAQPRGWPTRHRSRSVRKAPPTIRATPPTENPCRAIPNQATGPRTKCAKNRPTTIDKSARQKEVAPQTRPTARQSPRQSAATSAAQFRPRDNVARPRTKVPKANLPDRPNANGQAGKSIYNVSKQRKILRSSLNEFAMRPHREALSNDNHKHRRRRSPP